MNHSGEFSAAEQREEEAAAWLCERDEGFAPGRAEAFAAWREADPRNATAVAQVEQAWALLSELPAVRAPLEARVGAVPERRPGWRAAQVFGAVWGLGLAAALIVGVAVWRGNAVRSPAPESYATGSDSPRRVTLADGTVVELNARSALRIQFTAGERRVALDSGEAHFQVSPDPSRPFVVAAGGMAVRAVGTAFDVRLSPEAVDVLVVEGKVEVGRVQPDRPGSGETPVRPILGAGERVRVRREAPGTIPAGEKVDAATVRAALAWQERMASFTDVPLRDVVLQLNRRNVIQLVIADDELGARKVGGVIALDQSEAFVRLLEVDGDIASERRSENVIVLRRAR